jgi:peptide/nickel transport system permease protein
MRLPRWMRSARVLAGLLLVGFALVLAVLGPVLAPHDPQFQDLALPLQPVRLGSAYPLGTDALGRCILSRTLAAARPVLLTAAAAALGAGLLGGALGYAAGYRGGWLARAVARAEAVWLAFPPVVMALLLVAALGAGRVQVAAAIVLVDWTRFCRPLRRAVAREAALDHVTAARLSGFGHLRTLARDVLPGTAPLLAVLLAGEAAVALVVVATVSFLGLAGGEGLLGWGRMIADGREAMHQAPAGLLAPALVVVAVAAGFNLLADGLRRALSVRLLETAR